MELFQNAKAVRLKSVHNKYLIAEEDEENVTQSRDGTSKSAKWTVEFVGGDNIIRLKSCYNKYLTASNQPFLLGMTGRKVLQTDPSGRLDSSVEWEPVKEGINNNVKLKTRHGQFLRANGGLPPWRNSVTHDIPHRTATQDTVIWDVHMMEIIVKSPLPQPPPPLILNNSDHSSRSNYSPPIRTNSSTSSVNQEAEDVLGNSLRNGSDGRMIYYQIADAYGEIEEGWEELCITFKGNRVDELKRSLEKEIGIQDFAVCTKSPLNGKLYPLRLQLPPNNADMHIVVLPSATL